jgi:hypothetical protein
LIEKVKEENAAMEMRTGADIVKTCSIFLKDKNKKSAKGISVTKINFNVSDALLYSC